MEPVEEDNIDGSEDTRLALEMMSRLLH